MAAKYLSQIVSMWPDVSKATARTLTDAHHALQRETGLHGQHRSYEPVNEEGDQLPTVDERVQVTVSELLVGVEAALARLFDTAAARDFTNGPGDSGAVADVVVNNLTLVQKAPVPFLLWLDKQLDDLHTLVAKLPTHDPTQEWELDDAERGIYRSRPSQNQRTTPVPRHHVVFAPTDKQPGQAQMYTEQRLDGIWTVVRFTGSIPTSQRATMLHRIARLRDAINVAREEANRVEIVNPRPGTRILSFIFDVAS